MFVGFVPKLLVAHQELATKSLGTELTYYNMRLTKLTYYDMRLAKLTYYGMR